jgi:glycine betaine/proline transport system permease protein
MIAAGIVETGIVDMPWPFVLVGAGAVGWLSGGRKLAVFTLVMLTIILVSGLWERALLSTYLAGVSVVACAVLGGLIGLLCAVSPMAWRVVRPVCDMLQTIPLFVFLIPFLMFFQIGEFSAFLAICAYAIVPMIRYTRHGLVTIPDDLLDAAISSGATPWQVMREVRAPYAAPTILLGLNQTILYAFSMLVIAALIGTTGLGQSIFLALGQADVGLGIAAGGAMAILALVADRLVQGFAEERRKALGL